AATVAALATKALTDAGVEHHLSTAGNMFSIFFRAGAVLNYEEAKRQNVAGFAAFFHSLLAHGVYLPPSAFEAWFVSTALDGEALERVAAALPIAARAAADAVTPGVSGRGDGGRGSAK
ncbi:MAG TPA: hypothetical protein VFC19_33840, partial [Candidatus Limnocylindrales bacterium]|nr:hypothetical protein [Candidatus Limnocylindrales bacterium]